MENKRHYMFQIDSLGDKSGLLSVLESKKTIPFEIKRVFYEYNVSNTAERGNHANINSRFCFIALSGSCEVSVNDGQTQTKYCLNKPTDVLYLDNMVWKTMTNFSSDCILLVLSDCYYDQNEYIRDYDTYLECINKYH